MHPILATEVCARDKSSICKASHEFTTPDRLRPERILFCIEIYRHRPTVSAPRVHRSPDLSDIKAPIKGLQLKQSVALNQIIQSSNQRSYHVLVAINVGPLSPSSRVDHRFTYLLRHRDQNAPVDLTNPLVANYRTVSLNALSLSYLRAHEAALSSAFTRRSIEASPSF